MQKLLESTQYGLAVRAGPINLPALRARLEVSLSLEHERRDLIAHAFARNVHQRLVAREAASQHAGQGGSASNFENLPKLGLDVFALEKDKMLYRLPHQETRVPRQQNAPLLLRQGHEFIIGEAVGVEDVEAGDAKPLGEAPEHDIGNKQWPRVGGVRK